jgi:hypothetical protein
MVFTYLDVATNVTFDMVECYSADDIWQALVSTLLPVYHQTHQTA